MIWRALKRVPQYAIVLVVIVGSTAGFFIWRATYGARHMLDEFGKPRPVEDVRPKMERVAARHERLVLVDNDLYDLESGEVVFRNWLSKGVPSKLFWEPNGKTFLAYYERGFVRYGLDGKEQAVLSQKDPVAISNDQKWIVYVRDHDIWRADVNWKELKLENDRKLTSISQFIDTGFAANIMLGSDQACIVRNANQLVRVKLDNGEVHPVRLPLNDIGKRRSPDGRYAVGLQNGQFYCYDVDTDAAVTVNVGRGAINDFQWLDNDRCAAIAGGTKVILYDRKKNLLNEVLTLPAQCSKIADPSPGGRYLFCAGWKNGFVVDLEMKTSQSLPAGGGFAWVDNETFAFSREVPDSDLRGMWLEKAGEEAKRISPEPYLVNARGGGFIMRVPKADIIIFATKQGLSRMKPDGSEIADVAKLGHPPERVVGIQDWEF